MRVYHASNTLGERPEPRDVPLEDKHPNGALGIWCSFQNEPYLSGFGKYLYSIDLKDSMVFKDIDLSNLQRVSMEWCVEDYVAERARLRALGIDALRILEPQGVRQVILLHSDCISGRCGLLGSLSKRAP